MKYPRYPEYRPSNVDWLEEVPAHWDVRRLRFVASMNPLGSRLSGVAGDDMVSFVPMDAVGEYGGLRLDTERELAEIGSGYTYFADGDVVLAKITPCFENGKGALVVGLTNGVAFGTTELHVLRADQALDRRYLFYLTIAHPFRKLGESEMFGAGGQKRVPEDFIKDFRSPLPPLDEQQAIAAFLDRETTRIDALIATKRRFIALLQEKRAALISRTVTHGLDLNAPLKNSGDEWFGEIPVSWSVQRLKHLSHRIIDTEHKTAPYIPGGDYLVVRTSNVRNGQLDTSLARYTDADGYREWTVRGEPITGDVMFTREAPAGEACLVPSGVRCCIGQRMVLITPNPERLLSQWFVHNIYSGPVQAFIKLLSGGSTVHHLNMADIPNIPVPVPPIEEQRELVEFLARETSRISRLQERTELAIGSLIEHRVSLIAAAVTGKIDARRSLESENRGRHSRAGGNPRTLSP